MYPLEPDIPPTWRAGYSFPLSDGKIARVELDEIRSSECPKSIMLRSPESAAIVNIIAAADGIDGAFGPAHKWPGAFYDTINLIRHHKAIDEAAQTAAVHKA